jgi:hypothetical protein
MTLISGHLSVLFRIVLVGRRDRMELVRVGKLDGIVVGVVHSSTVGWDRGVEVVQNAHMD